MNRKYRTTSIVRVFTLLLIATLLVVLPVLAQDNTDQPLPLSIQDPQTTIVLSAREATELKQSKYEEILQKLESTSLTTEEQESVAKALSQFAPLIPLCSFAENAGYSEGNRTSQLEVTRYIGTNENSIPSWKRIYLDDEGEEVTDLQSPSTVGGMPEVWDLESISKSRYDSSSTTYTMDVSQLQIELAIGNQDEEGEDVTRKMLTKFIQRLKFELTIENSNQPEISLMFRLIKPTNVLFGVTVREFAMSKTLVFNAAIGDYVPHTNSMQFRVRAFLFFGENVAANVEYTDYDCPEAVEFMLDSSAGDFDFFF